VLAIRLTYSTDMRLVLFICISLLANIFHAAAMPVSHADPMQLNVSADDMHHAHMTTSDLKSENHCSNNSSPCCLVLALQPFPTLPLLAVSNQEQHTAFSPHHVKRTRSAPFRPPKFSLS